MKLDLEIEILFKDCIYLRDISYHNDFKYKLPFYTNECNILNITNRMYNNFEWDSIGVIINGKYEPKYGLHVRFNENRKKYILYKFRNNR